VLLNTDIEKAFSNQDKLIKTLKKDPIYQLYVNLKETYMKTADPQYTSLQAKIDACRRSLWHSKWKLIKTENSSRMPIQPFV
jgi:hypothetical protein